MPAVLAARRHTRCLGAAQPGCRSSPCAGGTGPGRHSVRTAGTGQPGGGRDLSDHRDPFVFPVSSATAASSSPPKPAVVWHPRQHAGTTPDRDADRQQPFQRLGWQGVHEAIQDSTVVNEMPAALRPMQSSSHEDEQ